MSMPAAVFMHTAADMILPKLHANLGTCTRSKRQVLCDRFLIRLPRSYSVEWNTGKSMSCELRKTHKKLLFIFGYLSTNIIIIMSSLHISYVKTRKSQPSFFVSRTNLRKVLPCLHTDIKNDVVNLGVVIN